MDDLYVSGKQMLDPGMSDDSINYVVVEIDGDQPENLNPVQSLCEGEAGVEPILVPYDDLLEHVKQMSEAGLFVEAIVYSFALGFVIHKL